MLVSFSEPLLISSISDPFIYSVDHNIFHPSLRNRYRLIIHRCNLLFRSNSVPSIVYELMVKDSICDCAGNRLSDSYTEFGLAFLPDSFDLVINEVLFDAREDEEFIEIINRSDRIIELSSLTLGPDG